MTEEEQVLAAVAATQAAIAANVRAERNALLAETDWMALQDRTMTQEEKDYRQSLRDITSQEGFPENVTWPTQPGGNS